MSRISLLNPDARLRPLSAIEADAIQIALSHCRGSMSEVARQLGIGRSTLYRKMEEHRLRAPGRGAA